MALLIRDPKLTGLAGVLDASAGANGELALTLYALPGEQYAIENRPDLSESTEWTFAGIVRANDLKTLLPLLPMDQSMDFFRAYRIPGVALSIRVEAGQLVIEWPEDCAGCILEKSDEVGSGALWSPSVAQPQLVGGRYRVTMPLGPRQRFYRLAVPLPE